MKKNISVISKILLLGYLAVFGLALVQPAQATTTVNIVNTDQLRNTLNENAQNPVQFRPSIDIPGNFIRGTAVTAERSGSSTVSLLGSYITSIYKFFVGIAAIIATFMIVLGGFMWLVSGGGDNIKKAKEFIISAIIGLVLILGSYVLLMIINPNLTRLDLAVPDVPKLALTIPSDSEATSCFVDMSCLSNGTCPGFSGIAATLSGVEVPKLHPCLAVKLLPILERLENVDNEAITIKALSRTYNKQADLFACSKLSASCPASCSESGCADAADPNLNPPHVGGRAVDLFIQDSGSTGASLACFFGKTWSNYSHLDNDLLGVSGSSQVLCKNGITVTLSDSKKAELHQDLALLKQEMVNGGLNPISSEWWHFEIPSNQLRSCPDINAARAATAQSAQSAGTVGAYTNPIFAALVYWLGSANINVCN